MPCCSAHWRARASCRSASTPIAPGSGPRACGSPPTSVASMPGSPSQRNYEARRRRGQAPPLGTALARSPPPPPPPPARRPPRPPTPRSSGGWRSSPPSCGRRSRQRSPGSSTTRLGAPFARWAERRWPHGRPAFGQHVKTTTVLGYLRVWMLTLLRPLRPISHRAHEEHARMDQWLTALARCAGWDKALALEVARGAQLVKGYGDVRRRMRAHLDRLLASVLRAAECEGANGGGFEASRELAARYRVLVLQGPG